MLKTAEREILNIEAMYHIKLYAKYERDNLGTLIDFSLNGLT